VIRSASLSALGTAREPPGWKSFWQSIKRSVVMVVYWYEFVICENPGSSLFCVLSEDFFSCGLLSCVGGAKHITVCWLLYLVW